MAKSGRAKIVFEGEEMDYTTYLKRIGKAERRINETGWQPHYRDYGGYAIDPLKNMIDAANKAKGKQQ